MKATDVIGYTLDGAAYCLEHAPRAVLITGSTAYGTVPEGSPVFADTSEALETVCDTCAQGYRLEIEGDTFPEAPDWDGMGYVYRIPAINVDRIVLEHSDYGTEKDAPYLGEIIREHGSVEDIADAVRELPDVVSVAAIDSLGWRSDAFLFVVTRANAVAWGCAPDDWEKLADQARASWSQYLDGDVWTVTVTERTEWSTEDGRERETWETVESCGGFYGREYAEEEGRALLAPFVTLGGVYRG